MTHQTTEAESVRRAVKAVLAQGVASYDWAKQEFRAAFILGKIGEIHPGSLRTIISMMKEAERAIWPDTNGEPLK